jgi:hypothetical protein
MDREALYLHRAVSTTLTRPNEDGSPSLLPLPFSNHPTNLVILSEVAHGIL